MNRETFENDDLTTDLATSRKYAVSLISAALGLGLFVSELKSLLSLRDPSILDCEYILLLIEVGILIFMWIWATQKELDILRKWLHPKAYDPPASLKETALILFIAIFLVALFYTAKNPLYFGFLFSAYNILMVFSSSYLNCEIKRALDDTLLHLKEQKREPESLFPFHRKVICILKLYFLKRPQITRYAICSVFAIIGLICCAWGQYSNVKLLCKVSYIIYLTTIATAECLIARWRIDRDAKIREVSMDIRQFLARKAKTDGESTPRKEL